MRRLVTVVATTLTLTTFLPVPSSTATTATIGTPGKATSYELPAGSGNCMYLSLPADKLYVALSPSEYAHGAACGGYLKVTGPKGTVRVKIVDQCPGCPSGHLDLSRTAFAKIADLRKGMVGITYRPVRDPRIGKALSFRVKEGSSQWWLALLVIDHGNPLASVEVRNSRGAWRKLDHTDYNYWIAQAGMGRGPFTVRVTNIRGHQVTVRRVRLAPAIVQQTTTTMYERTGQVNRPER